MHTSVLIENSIELINITPINPLISKCQIKVCYVGDKPNRNKSIITKEVAKQMANSLPGSPIVGYYNEQKQDFEEHNKLIEISNGQIKLKDMTRPYGFVDLNAKVWFAKYLDDDTVEREYLMTEGFLWTGQYPEAQRIIDNGNNQSMELDEKILNAYWTKDNKGKPKFFIINEAIFSKLCILGQDNEPCFEGANITAPKLEFSLEEGFKEQLIMMMEEIKNILSKGGTSEMNTYAVEIGDALWDHIYTFLEKTYGSDEDYCCKYRIEGVYEENTEKFAILKERSSGKYYQLNFSLTEETGFVAGDMFEVTQTFVPAAEAQFSAEEVDAYEATRYAAATSEEEEEVDAGAGSEETPAEPVAEEEPVVITEEPVAEVEDPAPAVEEPAAVTYNLDEIPEYVELLSRFNELQASYNELNENHNSLNETIEGLNGQISTLTKFKYNVEKKEKENMIKSFYMLSDEDKKDVIDNIDNYSIDEIESKLSVICVRNRVSFSLEEDNNNNNNDEPLTYNLNAGEAEDCSIPAWLKVVQAVAENM